MLHRHWLAAGGRNLVLLEITTPCESQSPTECVHLCVRTFIVLYAAIKAVSALPVLLYCSFCIR